METRLQRLCKALGWQGGTIWQAEDELTKRGILIGISVLEVSPACFESIIESLNKKLDRK